MNTQDRTSQFLAFTGKLQTEQSKVTRYTVDVCWCVNCGTKFEASEVRCWQCDQPNSDDNERGVETRRRFQP